MDEILYADVCMYVCMYACMYVCMHACMDVCMCVCLIHFEKHYGVRPLLGLERGPRSREHTPLA